MKINRKELFKLYSEKVDQICQDCDWVSTITPEMIVDIISGIIEKNNVSNSVSWEEVKKRADEYARCHSEQYCDENEMHDDYFIYRRYNICYNRYIEDNFELVEKQ